MASSRRGSFNSHEQELLKRSKNQEIRMMKDIQKAWSSRKLQAEHNYSKEQRDLYKHLNSINDTMLQIQKQYEEDGHRQNSLYYNDDHGEEQRFDYNNRRHWYWLPDGTVRRKSIKALMADPVLTLPERVLRTPSNRRRPLYALPPATDHVMDPIQHHHKRFSLPVHCLLANANQVGVSAAEQRRLTMVAKEDLKHELERASSSGSSKVSQRRHTSPVQTLIHNREYLNLLYDHHARERQHQLRGISLKPVAWK